MADTAIGKQTANRRYSFPVDSTAHLLGAIAGPELYACGYSRTVAQHVQDADGFWHTKVIYTAERLLHHFVAGEFNAEHLGSELVTCGHSGQLITLLPTVGYTLHGVSAAIGWIKRPTTFRADRLRQPPQRVATTETGRIVGDLWRHGVILLPQIPVAGSPPRRGVRRVVGGASCG